MAAAVALSGTTEADRPAPRGLPGPAFEQNPRWLTRAAPLGPRAPGWAIRLYRRSLLVLRAAVDPHTGAVLAGAPAGWAYVWPRDAGATALAFAAAGYRPEARRAARFLASLDLEAAARFYSDGEPVPGREAQGDAAGWAAVATRAGGVRAAVETSPWRDRADYQEKEPGDYLANAIASGVPSPRLRTMFVGRSDVGRGRLARRAGDPGSGLDTAAAWAAAPFPRPGLFPLVRRTLLRLAAGSGRFGLLPSEDWDGGEDPWTAPTAWTAWAMAGLGERRAALRLMAALRRAATQGGLLPERVDAQTGAPRSTTPLVWSHAFAVLALRELWPSGSPPARR
jgi:glycosyl hydrolase family 15